MREANASPQGSGREKERSREQGSPNSNESCRRDIALPNYFSKLRSNSVSTGLTAEAGCVSRAGEVNPIYTLLLCIKNHREKVPEYATHDPDNQD